MRLHGLFTIVAVACSGPPTPTGPLPAPAAPVREIVVPVDAAVPVIVGAACDETHPCGGTLSCERAPGGYCTRPCSEACGADPCVEHPAARSCRATCTSNADCREGYACDLQWKACIVPNAAAIVAKDCGAPPGFGRDPAFGPAMTIGTGDEQREPAATLADDGTLVVAHAGTNGIHVSRIPARGEVFRDRPLAIGTRHAWLARAGQRLFAVAHAPGERRIGFAMSSDRGVSWSKTAHVDEPRDCADGPCASRPMVVTGPDPVRKGFENIYVAYAAGDGLRVRASTDGGATFGPPRTAVAGSYGELAVAGDGTLYAIAVVAGPARYGSGDNRIELAISFDAGKSFTRPRQMTITGERVPYYFANPSVVVDRARRWVYLAYARGGRDGRWDLALLATNDRGKTWKRTRIGDDPPCAIHMVPNLALDPTTGQLHVAWYDSRGGRFAHAVCAYGLRFCRQLGRINDQPFAALSTMRAGELALGDYQGLVIDNARRILHAVWTQPVIDGGKPTARIFHAKARLPLR